MLGFPQNVPTYRAGGSSAKVAIVLSAAVSGASAQAYEGLSNSTKVDWTALGVDATMGWMVASPVGEGSDVVSNEMYDQSGGAK